MHIGGNREIPLNQIVAILNNAACQYELAGTEAANEGCKSLVITAQGGSQAIYASTLDTRALIKRARDSQL